MVTMLGRSRSAVTKGVWFLYRPSLHKVTQLHLTYCTIDAAHEMHCVSSISSTPLVIACQGDGLSRVIPDAQMGLCALKFIVNNA